MWYKLKLILRYIRYKMSDFNNKQNNPRPMENCPYNLRSRVQIKKTEKFSIIEKIPYKLYEVDINFDEAHDEWIKNKIKGKNGTYKYKNAD